MHANNRISDIEVLRAVAVLFVIFQHLRNLFPWPMPVLNELYQSVGGRFGVGGSQFIRFSRGPPVLSENGFSLCRSLFSESSGTIIIIIKPINSEGSHLGTFPEVTRKGNKRNISSSLSRDAILGLCNSSKTLCGYQLSAPYQLCWGGARSS
jgi:hypothetical protein